ncbi:MAG: serine hydrolase [Candidatus Saccharibacteria bacterium]|nr:serine hydrolase [Candidatus Saccharibacteria bacterium]
MKKIALRVALSIIVLLPTTAVVYVLFFQSMPTLEATYNNLPASEPAVVSVPWPDEGVATIGAVGYGLLDDSGNADEVVPIASITKLFTALAIMEQKPFEQGQDGETITFGQADQQLYTDYIAREGSAYPINAGDSLTQAEAMHALLIPSANNLADSLSRWAFGSEENFLRYVNDMAADMGLENTTIADTSGFSPESVSTPRELMVVAERVLQDPVLSEIVSKPSTVIDPAVGTIYNTNPLLLDQYVVGVKTGTTDEAGSNLIFAADFPLTETASTTIIGMVLGQPDRQTVINQSRSILQSGQKGLGFIEVVEPETVVGRYEVPWAEEVELVTNGGIMVGAWVGEAYQPQVEAERVEPGVQAQTEVGTLSVDHGSDTTSVPITTTDPIEPPSFWWRLLNIF